MTARIQGKISGGPGAAVGVAQVVATNIATNAATAVTTGSDGRYVLTSLVPGQYFVVVTLSSGETAVKSINIGVGQSLQVDLEIDDSSLQGSETIVVTSTAVSGRRTSEVATDISSEQLQNLPQNSRNFLNFALLAPGMRGSNDEFKQVVSSGGLEPQRINVFIDGISLKNNIIEGGVVGQDSSRGSPFPQLAVAGFRVITQNFKAEYEQAGSSIISSVTRSGGNEVHVEVFTALQNKSLVAIDPFIEDAMAPKPDYARYQVGGLISGPIVKDKLFALATYEGNYQNRANVVTIGNPTLENLARFGTYQGSFTSPFREHLGFGKVSWVPDDNQTFDLSATVRRETDIRNFGGQTSLQAAENVRNNVLTTSLRHQFRTCNDIVNEATAQLLMSQWNPGAENLGIPGQEFQGVVRIGGRDTDQDIKQRTITLRDDISLPPIEGAGQHLFKVGAKVALQRYDVTKALFGNPLYSYRIDTDNNLDFDAPFEARYGVGDPNVTSNNIQFGLYAQDDWQIGDRLTLNLGVRWDIESNPLNNDYKTPAQVRAAVTELAETVAAMNGPDFFPVNDYLTDGTQRSIYLGQIQPRFGASYDILGGQKTVVFAAAGRYFDRTLFNTGFDERYRLQYGVRTFRFSADGADRDGQPTIAWDPTYFGSSGLQELIDRGVAPGPEIFLLRNDTKPLHSDQYSFGVRQALGPVDLTVTFSHIRGENGVGFYPANRATSGNRDFLPVPGGFGNVLISANDIQTRFTGLYVTAEKSYRDDSRWGASATYTLGYSKIRGDLFNFDFPTIKDTPLTPGDSDERQRLVLSGIVALPLGLTASTLISLGTGLPYTVSDASTGFGANFRFRRNAGRDDSFLEFSQVDMRLAKEFTIAQGHHARVTAEVFNLFNAYNYGGYDGFIPPTAEPPNPKFGQPSRLIGPTRSFQIGISYGF